MLRHPIACSLAALVGLTLLGRAAAQEDATVYRALKADQIERMLKTFKIEYKKGTPDTHGIDFFDLNRGGFKVRLTSFDGKDLMVDSMFKPIPVERVNEWNKTAKFSRASLQKDPKGEFVALEYNLDVLGGITAGTVRQMIVQFDQELKNFDNFISGGAPLDQKVLAGGAPDAAIENVLTTLGTKFAKKRAGDGPTTFDFELHGFKLRLYNFGGKDLMIDAVFRKLDLERVNKYNLDRKFIRAVAYENRGGKDYTALESCLDCTPGVTEEMNRHYVVAFGDDVRDFANYVQNMK
jgi:hypothetical protein